jgi:hypothetical protein
MRKKTRKNGKEMKSVTKKRVRKWLTSEKKSPLQDVSNDCAKSRIQD